MSEWDVSRVTDFNYLLSGKPSFNQDLSKWVVSRGIIFAGMFNGAVNLDLFVISDGH